MDEAAQGIATAALTLQSVLLQALVHKGSCLARTLWASLTAAWRRPGMSQAPRKPARWPGSRKAVLWECVRGWLRWEAGIQLGPS